MPFVAVLPQDIAFRVQAEGALDANLSAVPVVANQPGGSTAGATHPAPTRLGSISQRFRDQVSQQLGLRIPLNPSRSDRLHKRTHGCTSTYVLCARAVSRTPLLQAVPCLQQRGPQPAPNCSGLPARLPPLQRSRVLQLHRARRQPHMNNRAPLHPGPRTASQPGGGLPHCQHEQPMSHLSVTCHTRMQCR